MASMVSAIWQGHPTVVLAMHTAVEPTDSEWFQYLSLVRSARNDGYALLTITDGGTPTLAQRSQLNTVLVAAEPKSAIITDALFIRNVTRARGLFTDTVRGFSPTQSLEAFAHLGIAPDHTASLLRAIYALQATLPPTRSYRELHAQQKSRMTAA